MLLNNKSKAVAYGGLFTALSVVFIYLTNILPYNKLAMLFIASLIILIGVTIIGAKYSLFIYISTSILSLFLIGIRGVTLSYMLFFGPYGLIKNLIEKLKKPILEIVLKLLYFNSILFLYYKLYNIFIPTTLDIQISLVKLVLLLQPVFIAYDYLLTLFIYKFRNRKHKI